MGLSFQDEASVAGVSADLEIEKEALLSGIQITYEGTNQAGQTLANTNMGNLRLDKGNSPKQSLDFVALQNLTDVLQGHPEAASAIGAAFRFTALFPFSIPQDGAPSGNNGMYFPKGGKIHVPALSTVIVATATARIYGIPTIRPQSYELQIYERFETLASGTVKIDYSGNILAFLLRAPATTDPTRVEVKRDDKLMHDASWDDGVAHTNRACRLESTTLLDVNYLDLWEERAAAKMFSRKASLTIIGGVGSQGICVLHAGIESEDTQRSTAAAHADTAQILSAARSAGYDVPSVIIPLPFGTGSGEAA